MVSAKVVVLLAISLPFGAASFSLAAEGRVELELFMQERTPLTAQRDWLEQLTKVGVGRLRIVAKGAPDKVGVEVRGTDSSPVYVVTGVITSNNDLLLPGGRYSLRNAGQAGTWLSDLAQNGPAKKPEEKAAFGLSRDQFEAIRSALAQPVGFPIQGIARAAVVDKLLEKLVGQLGLSVKIDPGLRQSIGDDPVAEDLSGLSSGTALACVLRPAGLCLVPKLQLGNQRTGQKDVQCVIVASQATLEVWPIGWEPKKSATALVPAYYEMFKANIENVPVTTVLDAVAKRLAVPFLLDHYALGRQKIEPKKALVNAPQSQTSYNQLLRKVLAQAKLKGELRVDEAGKPFFWVTTLRKP
jgi:hypothetical protein